MKKAGSRRNSQKMISAAFSLLLAVHILLARVVVFPDHSSTPHVCGRVQLVSGETVPIIYGVDYTGTKFTENVSVMQNPSNKDCSIYLCGPSVTSNVVEQSDIKESQWQCIDLREPGKDVLHLKEQIKVLDVVRCECSVMPKGLGQSIHSFKISAEPVEEKCSNCAHNINIENLSKIHIALEALLIVAAGIYFMCCLCKCKWLSIKVGKKGFEWKSTSASEILSITRRPSDLNLEVRREILDELKEMLQNFLSREDNDDPYQQGNLSVVNTLSRSLSLDAVTCKFRKACPTHQIFEMECCTVGELIGKGRYGHVFKCERRVDETIELVALKKIPWPCSEKNVVDSFLREIRIYGKMGSGHENILSFLGACCSSDGLYIMTRLCELGSLDAYLMKEMRLRVQTKHVSLFCEYFCTMEELGPVDLHQMYHWCEQIATGMLFLQSIGIFHVDLAARNILLTKDFTVKICDFGLSRQSLKLSIDAESLVMDFPINSFAPEWVAEDLNFPRKASRYSERWAFGCTLYEIFTLGDSMYSDVFNDPGSYHEVGYDVALRRFLKIVELLKRKYRHPKPQLAPDSIYHKMLECWNEVPSERPDFHNLKIFFNSKKHEVLKCFENTSFAYLREQ